MRNHVSTQFRCSNLGLVTWNHMYISCIQEPQLVLLPFRYRSLIKFTLPSCVELSNHLWSCDLLNKGLADLIFSEDFCPGLQFSVGFINSSISFHHFSFYNLYSYSVLLSLVIILPLVVWKITKLFLLTRLTLPSHIALYKMCSL